MTLFKVEKFAGQEPYRPANVHHLSDIPYQLVPKKGVTRNGKTFEHGVATAGVITPHKAPLANSQR